MTDEQAERDLPLRKVTFKLTQADIDRLRRAAARRYPTYRNKVNQTLRDILREEDERHEKGSGK